MSKFCPKCGKELADDAAFCGACGNNLNSQQQAQQQQPQQQPIIVNVENNNVNNNGKVGTKNKWVALILCFFLGVFGVHRFYEGKIITGLIWLFTGGLFGIGAFVDFFIILFKPTYYN